jgi:ankyrin repeat protein
MMGQAKAVKQLLQAGVEADSVYCGEEKVPGLVAAATRNHLEVMNALLEGGAGIDHTDAQGHTALHTACFCGSQQSAVFLVERGAEVNIQSKKGATPLAWAAHKGHIAVVKALLEQGAQVDGESQLGTVVAPSEIEVVPLLAAAGANRVGVVKYLLEQGAALEKKNGRGETALHCAAARDAVDCVKELLKRGADFGAVDDKCKTVVEKASDAGKCESLEYLIAWEQHGGEPPEEEKTVEEPVKWQPDFSKIDPLYYRLASWMGESQALVNACGKGELSVCRSLLEQGADPNSCQKMTPLGAASQGGFASVVELLLMSGADASKESQKKTPLQYAQEGGHEAVVQLLQEPIRCGGCAKAITSDSIKRCGKCKIVKYCGVECQKKAWIRFHRRQCTTWEDRKAQLNNRK